MKAKALVPLLIALILGVATFYIGKRVLNKQLQATTVAFSGARVLVASASLPAGYALTANDVQFAETAAEQVTSTMFRDPKAVEGRVLAAPLEAGQIIRQAMLAPEGTASALQAKVPPGMRAVTIAVNEFSGLAGLIAPGARVDLVATLVDNVSGETFAKTIVQNVEVSAVGQELETGTLPKADQRVGARMNKTVTLLVTPTQAAAIDLAFAKSKPRLVLRSSDDEKAVVDQGVTLAELSGRAQERDRLAETAKDETAEELKAMLAAMQKQLEDVKQASTASAAQPAAEVAPESPKHSVRVFRGGTESQQDFDPAGNPTGALPPTTRPTRDTQQVKAGGDASHGAAAAAQ